MAITRKGAATAVVGVFGALLACIPSSAQAAKPIVHERYSGTDSADFELCGLEVHREQTFSGVYTIRPAPGSDEAFLAHDRYRFTNVFTLADDDPDTNEFLRVEAHGNFREQKATLLDPDEPTIYRFKAADTSVYRMYDTDGDLVFRNSGVVKITAIFDTLGDGQPGGEVLEETVVEHGYPKAPDFCEVLVTALT